MPLLLWLYGECKVQIGIHYKMSYMYNVHVQLLCYKISQQAPHKTQWEKLYVHVYMNVLTKFTYVANNRLQ